jgi:signal transduction histidine kinase
VQKLIADTVQQIEPARNGRSIEVSVDNAAMQPVLVDTELMQLAIRQLLDNALKYSPRNTPVKVRADVRDSTLAIRIHNQGAALSELERDRVFEKFYRGAAVRDRIDGTGMGLAIAREILRAHGGDILLESSSDRGTEFAAMLPIGQKGQK